MHWVVQVYLGWAVLICTANAFLHGLPKNTTFNVFYALVDLLLLVVVLYYGGALT